MNSGNNINKTAFLGIFLALALIFSYVEALIPFFFGIPGMKLGLANSLVLTLLYLKGPKDALLVNFLRIILSGLLFGNVFAIVYSLSGGILSFILMFIVKKTEKFSPVTVSVIGGISHNIGQLLIAMVLLNTVYLSYYASLLLISGFITGGLMGIITKELLKRLGD